MRQRIGLPKACRIVANWGDTRQWHRKPKGWDKIRQRIALRDSYTCQSCGQITDEGHCSHIVPQAKGGGDADDNLRWLCEDCNMREAQHESMRAKGIEPRLSRMERRKRDGDHWNR